jgi:hemerythrin superfamily protein
MATTRTRKRSNDSDAIDMLKEDHRKVEKLFARFEKTDHDDAEACAAIVKEARAELVMHAAVEEELFYPAARTALGDDDTALLDEALVEHDTAKQLIARIEGLAPSDPMYAASFKVLAEYIKHHVKEEEGEARSRGTGRRDAHAQRGADGRPGPGTRRSGRVAGRPARIERYGPVAPARQIAGGSVSRSK